ncbi:hypothetical protein HanXRQr2_Chr04g0164181 [Helianthus annuus]|uniref:Uncharacterized protein n=1 Tax=Helianthus annuus TaxID=4232 RepID=A0A251UYG0_HELAN|nr:hypothetical protein HanXRQr2_Chr04g0164181 [Helianthus annuus]KAJ0931145.1 hypothetical protein HanPSC8_Chr04g0158111 [Helianthus annuus]
MRNSKFVCNMWLYWADSGGFPCYVTTRLFVSTTRIIPVLLPRTVARMGCT